MIFTEGDNFKERAMNTGGTLLEIYYRISTIQIRLPALRTKKEEIPQIAETILLSLNKKYPRAVPKVIDQETLRFLCDQPLRGNLRELYSLLLRAYITSPSSSSEIQIQDIL
jgi:two-component system response regulator PilR (NtrC family)